MNELVYRNDNGATKRIDKSDALSAWRTVPRKIRQCPRCGHGWNDTEFPTCTNCSGFGELLVLEAS